MSAAERPEDAGVTELPRAASLRRNAIASFAGNISLFAAIFLITPFAIRHLGAEGWGLWQIVSAASSYSVLLTLGLGTAIHYQVAYNVARVDVARLAQGFTGARIYLAGAGLLLLLLLAAFGRPFAEALVEPRLVEPALRALQISIGVTALTLPLRLYPSALAGLQRSDLHGGAQALISWLMLPCVWIALSRGATLPGFALLMTVGPLLPVLPAWLFARRLLPRGSLRWRTPDLPLLREIVGYSLSTLGYVLGTVVLYQTMKFVAALRCGGAEAAGHMGLAINIVQTLGVIFVPVLGSLHARFGQLHGEGRSPEIRALLERAQVATGCLVVPSLIFLALDAPALFAAWVGGEVPAEVVTQLATTSRLMLAGQGAYVLALPCYYALLGVGEHRLFGFAMLVTAIANAVIGWLATGSDPRIEVLGAVFGLLLLALAAGVIFPTALRRFALAPGRLARRSLLVPALASLPSVLAISWRPRLGHPIWDFALDAALFCLLAAPGLELARRRYLTLPAPAA